MAIGQVAATYDDEFYICGYQSIDSISFLPGFALSSLVLVESNVILWKHDSLAAVKCWAGASFCFPLLLLPSLPPFLSISTVCPGPAETLPPP